MKWSLFFISILASFLIFHNDAFCSETYFSKNNRVLLYKIINWWYDSLPGESGHLCNSPIKYQNKGHARVEYNENKEILGIKIIGGLGDQLSIFKQCEDCSGPSYFRCTWLNPKYFGTGEAATVLADEQIISTFTIHHIDKFHGQLIKRIEKNIVFEIEGTICGLLNGQISLHQAANLIKACPATYHSQNGGPTISITISEYYSKEVLAEYSAVMEH